MKVDIRQPKTAEDFENYYDLRWRILRKPWNQPKGSHRDEHEERAIHIMACMGNKTVGVGRVHFNSPGEAQLRYMAVETSYQGKGIGSLVLRQLEKRARKQGAKYMLVNGRENAVRFYKKNGYTLVGDAPTLFGCIKQSRLRKDFE
jgi:GNAT superfamily N-acetyltransferase